jgi:hypothetical protein
MYDPELDSFKRHIHLVDFACERYGYVRDRRESSRACHVLRHDKADDKIVVRQDADGHWTYFSVRDSSDSGTVIDFLQRRRSCGLREVRGELRRYLGSPHPEAGWSVGLRDAPRTPFPEERSAAEAFSKASRAHNCAYLNSRGLKPETLCDPRFVDTWRVGHRGNVYFAHTDDAGLLTGFEIKNRGFTGFSAGGRKAAWQSVACPEDRALVIAESAIDALSHYQLHPRESGCTRYLSTAGQPSRAQVDVLDRVFAAMPRGSTVVVAVDVDEAGRDLARYLEDLTRFHRHLVFRRDEPPHAKDWNEVLQRIEHDYIRSLSRAVERACSGPER